ncbi:hypothetical protein EGP64_03945 [bacterium]|nr:hypothetical protein [bacterium]
MKEVYISIKPKYTKLIKSGEKNYEFRKYFIKDLKTMFVYESENSCLKYIMEVGSPVCFPNKIEDDGIGNKEFNQLGEYQYAYPIIHLYELKKPIFLTELRSKYKFCAPQKYTMATTYPELKKELDRREKIEIY